MTTRRTPVRRSSAAEDRLKRTIAAILQRVVVVEGPRAEELVAGLTGNGINARSASAAALPTMAAGIAVYQEIARELTPSLGTLRSRHAPVAVIALRDPSAPGLEDEFGDGADAILPADASVGVIAAQLRVLARLLAIEPPSEEPELITVRNLTVDLERREVRAAAGKTVSLTPTEFRILSQLARRPGRVVSHGEIFREVHGYDVSDHEAKDILKVHIWRLRSKLAEHVSNPSPIVNVRGFGYMLERRLGRERRTRPVKADPDGASEQAAEDGA